MRDNDKSEEAERKEEKGREEKSRDGKEGEGKRVNLFPAFTLGRERRVMGKTKN